jgi:hypothetical protein
MLEQRERGAWLTLIFLLGGGSIVSKDEAYDWVIVLGGTKYVLPPSPKLHKKP